MVQTIKKDFVVVYIPTPAFNKQFPRLNNIKELQVLQVLESDKQACCLNFEIIIFYVGYNER